MNELNSTLDVTRGDPKPRTYSRAFWDATRDKKFLLQYDPRNGRYQFFPRPASIVDGGPVEWREVSGRGVLFSYTIVHRAPPPFRGHEPFAIGLVTLEEGVNVMSDIIGCQRNDLKIGMPMRLAWAPLPSGAHQPLFEPDPAGAAS